MNPLFQIDEWKVIENGFSPERNRLAESAMSLGNGYMGMRGNFEEAYSGDSLQGTYIAGIYYPDKTRVGWWKNGYPEYFAKVLNAVNFIGIDVSLNGTPLDLHQGKVLTFKRELNMKHGCLSRSFTIRDQTGRETHVATTRFVSRTRKEIAAISYTITPLNYDGEILLSPYLDGDVVNEDANYGEKFWIELARTSKNGRSSLTMQTKKSGFVVTAAMGCQIHSQGKPYEGEIEVVEREKYVSNSFSCSVPAKESLTIEKLVAITTNRDHLDDEVAMVALSRLEDAMESGYANLLKEHTEAWENHWNESDIVIEGDCAAQQGIRFNIFHLNQTYTGEDPRLNIGPKGFTGEKYGGSTYWDTEAYCLPFYLSTSEPSIPRNLLIYRYNHLQKAKENAEKLGCRGALYPMVTVNGEECHNEWEITFEEIHRNAAIAYAIFNYVRYTGDQEYLAEYGFEVLVEISRYWASRAHFQRDKDVFMILGVTGPNEYENNVNNNWYTNRMAVWTMQYTLEVRDYLKGECPKQFGKLTKQLGLTEEETALWQEVISKMHYPIVASLGIYEQQDGYMDKEQKLVAEIPKEELPLNQNWSWDRILRSCFIKQADVLQGLFFLSDKHSVDCKRRNFDFYEPRTVHESSLSPCVHSILAAEIGYEEQAYQLYLRTARLDLDNYNNDSDDGLHITSMAGTWMSIVYGFGGMRVHNGTLSLNPFIPKAWVSFSFKLLFRGHLLKIEIKKDKVTVCQEGGSPLTLMLFDKAITVEADQTICSKI